MYIQHPDLFELSAQVIQRGHDNRGTYLVLNQSLFYPQGGGQPADQGQITTDNACYKVFDVRNMDGEIRHYITSETRPTCAMDTVTIKIDKERRIRHSKYHTAGHLIAAVVEKAHPALQAIKGHQFPGEAYIEFKGTVVDTDDFIAQIRTRLSAQIAHKTPVEIQQLSYEDAAIIAQRLPYKLPTEQSLRVCHIAGFPPTPCGGTHVNTLEEINTLVAKKCRNKKGTIKIHYEVE